MSTKTVVICDLPGCGLEVLVENEDVHPAGWAWVEFDLGATKYMREICPRHLDAELDRYGLGLKRKEKKPSFESCMASAEALMKGHTP